jgi:hypothetical protein
MAIADLDLDGLWRVRERKNVRHLYALEARPGSRGSFKRSIAQWDSLIRAARLSSLMWYAGDVRG